MPPSPRILLIEDDSGAASSLKRLLAAEGYSVEVAPDGTAGLHAARSGDHDVVITDWRLPGASGIEIIREARQVRPGLPVILMSGRLSDELKEAARDHGANELLAKPGTAEGLMAALRRVLGNGAAAKHKLL